jgi:hypothetical protein
MLFVKSEIQYHILQFAGNVCDMFYMISNFFNRRFTGICNKLWCEIDLDKNKMEQNHKSRFTRFGINRTITTASVNPSPTPINFRMSLGTFRGTSWTDLADEWDQITGAFDTWSACLAVASDVWDRSTSTPRRFISAIKDLPIELQEYSFSNYFKKNIFVS